MLFSPFQRQPNFFRNRMNQSTTFLGVFRNRDDVPIGSGVGRDPPIRRVWPNLNIDFGGCYLCWGYCGPVFGAQTCPKFGSQGIQRTPRDPIGVHRNAVVVLVVSIGLLQSTITESFTSFEFSGLFYPTKGVGGKRYDPCVMQRRRWFGKGGLLLNMAIFGIYIRFLGYTLHLLGLLSIFLGVFFCWKNLQKHFRVDFSRSVGKTCDFCEVW